MVLHVVATGADTDAMVAMSADTDNLKIKIGMALAKSCLAYDGFQSNRDEEFHLDTIAKLETLEAHELTARVKWVVTSLALFQSAINKVRTNACAVYLLLDIRANPSTDLYLF